MKLLDFTGRKVDPSLLLGDMKTKKEKDPNIKVRRFLTDTKLSVYPIQVYRAYKPYVSVVLHTPKKKKKETKAKTVKKEVSGGILMSVITGQRVVFQERALPLDLLLQCCTTTILLSPEVEDPGDKVEAAFRTLDSDGDGYLILEDFVQVRGQR